MFYFHTFFFSKLRIHVSEGHFYFVHMIRFSEPTKLGPCERAFRPDRPGARHLSLELGDPEYENRLLVHASPRMSSALFLSPSDLMSDFLVFTHGWHNGRRGSTRSDIPLTSVTTYDAVNESSDVGISWCKYHDIARRIQTNKQVWPKE